ncbi:PPE domain-containing protein [Mycobacterium sp. 663a-19]|uniref:PPE family protein, SVP subgroup n=1 Tax=Mycobacterium sp. 663a-19 TaxID=2986148 RepID=UPI002D1EF79E|nr:PPE domain-containing protein [Mycobacterium sp. 663a-19]MEB3981803.1 PPE domain-containing protein [Mycobacterium sp. 663a-19]
MDFAALPPEINSGRMYAGAGSGPMLAAAAAWDTLAAELHAAASSYQSVLSGLIAGPWLGPSSASMAAAAATTAAWMNATAAQAEQTGAQAKMAAAAYESAFADTVPPPVIAANRAQLATLVATNLLGQNTPAIAATEAEYAEMWARDAAAMYGYALSSAAATTLSPFTEPPRTTSPAAGADQATAVGQSTGTAAGNAQSIVSSVTAVPNALIGLGAPAAADPPSALTLINLLGSLSGIFVDPEIGAAGLTVGSVALPFDVASALTGLHTDEIVSGWAGIQAWPGSAPVPPTPFPVITNLAGGTTLSAGLGGANKVGALSVPAGWTAQAPAIRPAALGLPAASTAAAPEAALTIGTGSPLGDMAVGATASRALSGALGGGGRRERAKATTGDTESLERGGVVKGIAAELRELAELRDSGVLTNEEFLELKRRLLGR